MKDPILLLRNGEFIDCNTATLSMLGYGSKADLLHSRPSDLSPPVQPDGRPSEDKAADMIARSLRDGFHRFEWIHLRADGTPIEVEVTLTPIIVDGEVILHTLWRDISARKRADEALRRSEAKLRAIYDTTTDAVMLLDRTGFFDCNRATLALFGCASLEEFCSKHPGDLSPPVQPGGAASGVLADRMISQALDSGSHRFEWVHRRADTGADFPADVQLTAMTLDGRRVLQAVVRDMSERIAIESALRSREVLLRMIFDTSSVAIFFIDAGGLIGDANRRMAEMFALPLEDLIGASYGSLVAESEREEALGNMRRHLDQDRPDVSLERRYLRADGTVFLGHLTANRIPDLGNGSAGLVCVIADITERKLAEQTLEDRARTLQALNRELAAAHQELERRATRDGLTGALNRQYLEEVIHQEIRRLERYCHPVSLIFFDLDHFKAINDTYGHAVGDSVLRQVCDLARRCMRSTDVLARWGGEEFLIATPNGGLAIAGLLAERIRATIAAHAFPVVGHVTASFGVAECRPGESWEGWLARADAALYAAKQAGRDRVLPDTAGESGPRNAEPSAFLHLRWSCSYNSGLAEIDRQHQGMFDHANALLAAITANRPRGDVMALAETMLADLRAHFAEEEQILVASAYADVAAHIRLHRQMEARATDLLAGYAANRLPARELADFIAHEVVAAHILAEDQKVFAALRRSPQT